MKKIIIFLTVFLYEFNCFANVFFTKGHQKSQGLNIQINYPDGWESKESDDPSIIQYFIKNTIMCSFKIQTSDRHLLQQISELYPNFQDYVGLIAKKRMEDPFVRQYVILKHTPVVHNGQPGLIMETFQQWYKHDIILNVYTYEMQFIFNDAFVQLDCYIGGPESPDIIKERFEKNKHDFVLFRDGLIFSDKRK